MPTSYTSLLGLALPVTGELSGTWGDTVNNYITSYIDAAVAGAQTISGTQTSVTLSVTTNASLSQVGTNPTGSSQYQIINCTGSPSGLLTITVPAASKAYLVLNNTSTSQSVKIVGTGPTTGVTVAAAQSALVAWNGTDFELVASTDASTLTGVLAVANGGTGLTSGTSGGVLAFTAAGTLASSSALAANAVVIGGGAGAAPSTTTTGTGVVTAIGNGVNTTGGLVTQSGTLAASSLLLGGGASTAITSTTTGTGVVTAIGNNTNSANGLAVLNSSAALPVANGGLALTSIAARSIPVANSANIYTTVTPAAGQSIRINAGNTAWEAYTPSTAAGDAVLANNNAFTGANTFYNATGQTFAPATANDGIIVKGRAGGTSTYRVTLATDTLSASRTLTLPNNTGTVLTTGAAVTVAQGGTGLTTLTANNVILGNGTSTPSFVAPGTNGNVLTSNGTTWTSAAPAGGGAWDYITTVTASGAATADIDSTYTGYDVFVIIGVDMYGSSSSNTHITGLLKVNGTYGTSSNYTYSYASIGATAYSGAQQTGAGSILYAPSSTNIISQSTDYRPASMIIYVYNPSSTSAYKGISWQITPSGLNTVIFGQARWTANASQSHTLTGVRITPNIGNISGTFRLYGIKNS